jgi:choline dehydrogenase
MWDYIILGAGTAGSVLAHALTQSGRDKVLLIEAGGKPGLMSRIPAGMPKLFRSKFDWAFQSEPQAALGGRSLFVPRGKMLGGSSNMNAQIHQWCHPADYDGWKARGLTGWGWDEVAPVFRGMEAWSGAGDDQSRGALGPMPVCGLDAPNPLSLAFVAAARRSGFADGEDYNGRAYGGAWLCQLAHRKGGRFSAYHAYLEPALKRPNLKLLSGTLAERILFEGRRAVGVRAGGEEHRAARGVILAGGAFGSPHLLMLSGVGPAEHLRNHGIEVVHDSPGVGANLQDHLFAPVKFATREPVTLKAAGGLKPLLQWLLFRRGMLASNVAEAFLFANVSGGAAPDLEIIFAPVEWRAEGLEDPVEHAVTFGPIVLTPRSSGTVRLTSREPGTAPAIDFGLLTDPEGADARVLLEGARLSRKLAAAEPLAEAVTGELPESASARSDEALLAYLKSQAQTLYHPVGTCRMGVDADAPLDGKLAVRGLDGLWVADASVMPSVPRGHTNAPTAMIAARAAQWLS